MRKRTAFLAAAMISVALQASPANGQSPGASAVQYGSEGGSPAVGIFRVTLDGEMPEGRDVYVRSADVTLGAGSEELFVCTTNRERIEADPEFNKECRDGGGVNEVEFMAPPDDTVEYDVIMTDDYGENEKLLASDSFTMEEGVVVDVYRDLNGGTVATEPSSSTGQEASQYDDPSQYSTSSRYDASSQYGTSSQYGAPGEVSGTLRLRIGGELPEGVDVHLRVTSGRSSGTGGAWICSESPEEDGSSRSGRYAPCKDGVNEATFVWREGEPFEYEIVLDDDDNLGNTAGYEILATGSGVMENGLVLEESVDFDGEATSGETTPSGEEPQSEPRSESQEEGGGLFDALTSLLRRIFE